MTMKLIINRAYPIHWLSSGAEKPLRRTASPPCRGCSNGQGTSEPADHLNRGTRVGRGKFQITTTLTDTLSVR